MAWLTLALLFAFFSIGPLSPLDFGRPRIRGYLPHALLWGAWTTQDEFVERWISRGLITPGASLSASSKYLPHLAERQQAWRFPITGGFGQDAQFILVDTAEVRSAAEQQTLERILRTYPLAAQAGSALLFDRQALRGLSLDLPSQDANGGKIADVALGEVEDIFLQPFPQPVQADPDTAPYVAFMLGRKVRNAAPGWFLPHDLIQTERMNFGLPIQGDRAWITYGPNYDPMNVELGDTLWVVPLHVPEDYALSADEYVLDLLATPEGRRTIQDSAIFLSDSVIDEDPLFMGRSVTF